MSAFDVDAGQLYLTEPGICGDPGVWGQFGFRLCISKPGTQYGPELRELFGCCQHLMMFQFACLLYIRTRVFGTFLVSHSLWNEREQRESAAGKHASKPVASF